MPIGPGYPKAPQSGADRNDDALQRAVFALNNQRPHDAELIAGAMARKITHSRPPPSVTRAKLKLRDRFGLPIYPPSVLDESVAERHVRIAKVIELVADAFTAVAANLGRRNARALFGRFAQKRSTKNRRPDKDRRRQFLEMYDQEAAKTPGKTRLIAGRLGHKLHPKEPMRAASTAAYIRRAVKQRARERHAVEEEARRYPPSMLDIATDPNK